MDAELLELAAVEVAAEGAFVEKKVNVFNMYDLLPWCFDFEIEVMLMDNEIIFLNIISLFFHLTINAADIYVCINKDICYDYI